MSRRKVLSGWYHSYPSCRRSQNFCEFIFPVTRLDFTTAEPIAFHSSRLRNAIYKKLLFASLTNLFWKLENDLSHLIVWRFIDNYLNALGLATISRNLSKESVFYIKNGLLQADHNCQWNSKDWYHLVWLQLPWSLDELEDTLPLCRCFFFGLLYSWNLTLKTVHTSQNSNLPLITTDIKSCLLKNPFVGATKYITDLCLFLLLETSDILDLADLAHCSEKFSVLWLL